MFHNVPAKGEIFKWFIITNKKKTKNSNTIKNKETKFPTFVCFLFHRHCHVHDQHHCQDHGALRVSQQIPTPLT